MNLHSTLGVFALGLAGAAVGLRLEGVPRLSHKLLTFSGLVLIAMGAFWLVPEIAVHYGMAGGLLWVAVGFALLWTVDRYVYPVCPSCSHTHEHEHCHEELHGFAVPLIVASGLHSFLDGWSMLASQGGPERLRLAVVLAIGLHKIPEGLALGAILRASTKAEWRAWLGCILAQSMTVVGGACALWLAPRAGTQWVGGLLGLAGGSFIYLGYHAVEPELRRRVVAVRSASKT